MFLTLWIEFIRNDKNALSSSDFIQELTEYSSKHLEWV